MIIPSRGSCHDQISGSKLATLEPDDNQFNDDLNQPDEYLNYDGEVTKIPMHLYASHSSSSPTTTQTTIPALISQFIFNQLFTTTTRTIDFYDNLTTTTTTTMIPPTTTIPPTTVDPTTTDEPTISPFDFHDESSPYMSAEKWFEKYLWWRVILVTYILLLGLIGNSAVIYSICKTPRFRSKPTNIFILNMAIGDLITSIFCPIVALIKVVNEFYVMGWFICRIEGFVKITCLFVSSYSLIILSFQWLLCVIKPFWKRMSIGHSWIALGIIWALSLGMGIPLIFKRKLRSRKWLDLVERWCQEDTKFITYYWITVCFSLIYVPIICMTVALVIILVKMDNFGYKLRRSNRVNQTNTSSSMSKTLTSEDFSHKRHEFGRDSSIGDTNNNITTLPHLESSISMHSIASRSQSGSVDRKSNYKNSGDKPIITPQASSPTATATNVNMKYRKHIVSILLIYLLVSAICWTPLNLSIIYRLTKIRRTFFPNSFNEFNFFCELGVATSSALNPIIFGFLSRSFRQTLNRSWLVFCNNLFNLFSFSRSRPTSNSRRSRTQQSLHPNHNKTTNQQKTKKRSQQNIQLKVSKKNESHQITNPDRISGLSKRRQQFSNLTPSSSNTARSTSALVSRLVSQPNSGQNRSRKRVTFHDTTSQNIIANSVPKEVDQRHTECQGDRPKTSLPNPRLDSPKLDRHSNDKPDDVNMNPGGNTSSVPDDDP